MRLMIWLKHLLKKLVNTFGNDEFYNIIIIKKNLIQIK